MKLQEEREAAREQRDRLREERKAEEELQRERERLERSRVSYQQALDKLRAQGRDDETGDLVAKLEHIDTAIAENEYRQANTRVGHVYVISNVGAFGEGVVKIGFTRRLDPYERIRELGDASVPFPFDVHAVIFADDAVSLEHALHEHFAARRLNHVNLRREFFFATSAEVHEALASSNATLLHFVDQPEATQYQQSRTMWPRQHGRHSSD